MGRLLQGCEKALALRQRFKGTTSPCAKALRYYNVSVKTVVQLFYVNKTIYYFPQ